MRAAIRDVSVAMFSRGMDISGFPAVQGAPFNDYKQTFDVDLGRLNRTLVLNNDAVFGSVNANRRHYEDAVATLQRANRKWLSRLITRRVPADEWTRALDPEPDDIKVVVDF